MCEFQVPYHGPLQMRDYKVGNAIRFLKDPILGPQIPQGANGPALMGPMQGPILGPHTPRGPHGPDPGSTARVITCISTFIICTGVVVQRSSVLTMFHDLSTW